MQPGVVLTKDYAHETPDLKEQKIYRSFVAKIQFVANWARYDASFAASQWLVSVHQPAYRIGPHCIM
jgi:hypothetical protein